jgi:hypothetical protein
MTEKRHADAVRSYLDYLCGCPVNGEVIAWSSWVGRTMGATAMVSFTLTGSCTPQYPAPMPDTGGSGGGGGAAATGGGGAAATGGGAGTAGMGTLYGIPSGGTGAGGVSTDGSGGIGGMAVTPLYGVPVASGD